MATDMKRFTISVTPEMEKSIEKLKKSEFYNKPYSEMYRYILNAGILAIKDVSEQQKEDQEATA